MKMYSINYKEQQTKYFDHKSQYSSPIAFEGALTRLAQKRPTVSADLLRAANKVHTRDNGFVGIFPPEFVSAIKKNLGDDCCPQKIKECIEGTKATFADVIKLFEQIEIETNNNAEKNIKELDFDKCLKNIRQNIKVNLITDYAKATKIFTKIKNQFLPNKNFIKDIEKQAAKTLEMGLLRNKLISLDVKIKVKRLDNGLSGTAYKISFLDNGNKNVFRDKVIKYYRDPVPQHLIKLNSGLKQFELIKENFDKTLLFAEKIFKSLQNKKDPQIQKGVESYRSVMMFYKTRTIDQQKEIAIIKLKNRLKELDSKCGINKEANNSNYIRKASGHNLQKSNLITHYYSDLNNNYALLDFSDYKILGPVTKEVDYDLLGFIPEDITGIGQLTNFVDSRLVDYGHFSITNKILSENPVARRIYKKIKHVSIGNSTSIAQQRIDKFNEFYEKAINNKLPQSSDVLLGLKAAKILIPKENHNLLMDYMKI